MYLTSYLIDDLAVIAYRKGFLSFDLGEIDQLTTTLLNGVLLIRFPPKGFKSFGFDLGMPCAVNATVIDMEPEITVDKKTGLGVKIQVSANIKCKKKADDPVFY